jgi:hypothetical protein
MLLGVFNSNLTLRTGTGLSELWNLVDMVKQTGEIQQLP